MIIIAYYKHHYERTLAAIIRDEPHEASKRAIHLLAADTPFFVAPIQAAIVSEALSTMLPKRARRAPKQCYSQSRSLSLSRSQALLLSHCASCTFASIFVYLFASVRFYFLTIYVIRIFFGARASVVHLVSLLLFVFE